MQQLQWQEPTCLLLTAGGYDGMHMSDGDPYCSAIPASSTATTVRETVKQQQGSMQDSREGKWDTQPNALFFSAPFLLEFYSGRERGGGGGGGRGGTF